MSPTRPEPFSVLAVLGVRADDEAPDPNDEAVVDCAVYCDGARVGGTYEYSTALELVRRLNEEGRESFLWLGIHEPTEHQMASVADAFELHPIPVEDAVHAHQRPKVERYDDTLFVVLKTVNYVPHESVTTARRIAETGEIMIFASTEFVIAIRHGDHSGLSGLRRELEVEGARLRLGPYGVMQSIIRHVVGSYLAVIGPLEHDIDDAEERTFSATQFTPIEQIYLLKRDVLELRRAIAPLGTALHELTTDHMDLLPREVIRYLQDAADQQTHAAEQIASYDDMLSDLVKAALARAGLQQNLDMRRISAWVVIVAVPTMIAGIYGMNFEYMPELAWRWGYPAVLSVICTICLILYITFRRKHWL